MKWIYICREQKIHIGCFNFFVCASFLGYFDFSFKLVKITQTFKNIWHWTTFQCIFNYTFGGCYFWTTLLPSYN